MLLQFWKSYNSQCKNIIIKSYRLLKFVEPFPTTMTLMNFFQPVKSAHKSTANEDDGLTEDHGSNTKRLKIEQSMESLNKDTISSSPIEPDNLSKNLIVPDNNNSDNHGADKITENVDSIGTSKEKVTSKTQTILNGSFDKNIWIKNYKESKKDMEKIELECQGLENSWFQLVLKEFDKDYFMKLKKYLKDEKNSGKKVFPAESMIHYWSRTCTFSSVKVVILGQDPYHGDGQAMGLAFSVPVGITPPPSLLNIYSELEKEYPDSFHRPSHGCLTGWAEQGVLLLNTSLTVRASSPGSHSSIGWEKFTDAIINAINDRKEHIVFLLWGNHAIAKGKSINKNKHAIFTAAHPSPLSAHRGFFGCGHFKKANDYLLSHGKEPINWNHL